MSKIIINGGNPLEGSPKNWEDAHHWTDNANENGSSSMKWSFDCGFKLDYDGSILKISSRFYPPTEYYGSTWDGNVTVILFGEEVAKQSFDCKTLDELRTEVEKYVNSWKEKIKNILTQ